VGKARPGLELSKPTKAHGQVWTDIATTGKPIIEPPEEKDRRTEEKTGCSAFIDDPEELHAKENATKGERRGKKRGAQG